MLNLTVFLSTTVLSVVEQPQVDCKFTNDASSTSVISTVADLSSALFTSPKSRI